MRTGQVLVTLIFAIIAVFVLSTSVALADSDGGETGSYTVNASQQTYSSGGYQTMSVTWCRAC
jgi:hypothetical protein